MALTALMTNDQALSDRLWPAPFQWGNFVDVFESAPLWRWALNSFIYSSLATLGLLVSSIPVAYAFSRMSWRGRDAVFLVVLVALMLPPQVSVVPLYVMWAKLDLVGSLWPLIIPNWFGDAFAIFLLRQFFLTVPQEYVDAARVDGCGELRILTTVMLQAGEAGDRRGRPLLGALHLERLLPAAPLRRREPRQLGRLDRALAVPRAAPGAVEPDHGGDAPDHAAGRRRLLPRPEGVRGGRHADRGQRMKIAVVGAGSTYTPELVSGLSRERERIGVRELVLHDVDAERLEIVGGLAERMLARQEFEGELVSTGDLDRALDGADFVLVQIRVGGQAARLSDETVPLACGCIGQETTGAGGLGKALRTVPVVLEIAERARELAAPDAWIVDFTNPVGIVTRSLLDAGHRAVGLCNVAIGFQRWAAGVLDAEPARVLVDQVGLNHLTWIRAIRLDGDDVLPELLADHGDELAERADLPRRLLDELGVVPSPYLRYFYRHDEVLAGQLTGVPRAATVAEIERELLDLYRDPALAEKPALLERRGGAYYSEAATGLIASLVTGGGEAHVVDIRNEGTIAGLAADDVVELPARIGATARPRSRRPPLAAGAARPRPARRRLRAARRGSGDERRRGTGAEGSPRSSSGRPAPARGGPGRAAARRRRSAPAGVRQHAWGSRMRAPIVLAVDGGNSKTDLALVRADGEVLALVRGPASSPHHLGLEGAVDVLERLVADAVGGAGLRRDGGPFAEVAELLLAGVDFPSEERRFQEAVGARAWAVRARVANDTFAVLRAGTERGWGVAVVCGSGINCVGVAPDGRHARFPALGAITGDWGGGYDVGLEAVSAAARGEDGRGPRTSLERRVPAHFGLEAPSELAEAIHEGRIPLRRVIELAPIVLAEAAHDAVAASIVDRLASEIVAFVRVTLDRLDLAHEPVEVVLGGGLFQAELGLLAAVEPALGELGPAVTVHGTTSPPVLGAGLLGLDQLGANGAAQDRLRSELVQAVEHLEQERAAPGDGEADPLPARATRGRDG